MIMAGIIVAVGSVAAPLNPTPAAAADLSTASGFSSGFGQNTSSCAIETVGWVICPVMRSIARLADYGFAFINQNFLRIEYDIRNTDSGVYKAWELMRNVADALFVIAFMIIIYFQITGRNAGGYSIKRILPRLIIGAVFVNLSYFVCAIAIEASNILGDQILNIMKGVASNIGTAAMSLDSAKNNFDDSRLSDITSGILTKSGTVWILLAPVAAVTVAIAVICAAGLVLLIMRKVVVAMLILVSPLVFVAYLLPNMEHYFQQWTRLFLQLLILYPIIAFLLGTGQIISATIVNVGSGGADANYSVQDDSYNGRNGGSGSATTDLAAAGAAVLPLLGVWFLLKNLTALVSNARGRLADFRNGSSKEQEEKIKAKLDSKEKQGALPGAAGGLPTYERRRAFSRLSRRRKASPGGSALTGEEGSKPQPNGQAGAANAGLGNMMGLGGNKPDTASEAAKKLEQQQNASANPAEIAAATLGGQVEAALKADDKKGKSAKDIFNNMNHSHQPKDAQRSLGGAAPAQGGGGGGGQAAPSAPTSEYRAPAIMQSANTTSSAPQAGGAAPTRIVAVPVQVDAASFLPQQPSAATPDMTQMVVSDTQKKAKARAQQYMFDAADEIEKAGDAIDPTKKRTLDQPPHTNTQSKD